MADVNEISDWDDDDYYTETLKDHISDIAKLLGTDDKAQQLERLQQLKRTALGGFVAVTFLWDDAAGKVISLTATSRAEPLQVLEMLSSASQLVTAQMRREREDQLVQRIPQEVDVVEAPNQTSG